MQKPKKRTIHEPNSSLDQGFVLFRLVGSLEVLHTVQRKFVHRQRRLFPEVKI